VNNLLQFHFPTFALCTVTPPDPEYPMDRDNQPDAELIGGLFRSRDEAENFVRLRERERLLAHEREMVEYRSRFGFAYHDQEYRPGHYEIVPLKNVRFETLQALEDSIRAAAVLMFSGVGAEASANG
jgi:hypothetical protein